MCSAIESSAAQRGVFSDGFARAEKSRREIRSSRVSAVAESESRVRLIVVRGVFGRDAETPRDDDVHAVRVGDDGGLGAKARTSLETNPLRAAPIPHARGETPEAPGDVRGDASVQRRSRARESSGGGVRQRGDDGTSGSRAKRHRRSLSREEKKRAHG